MSFRVRESKFRHVFGKPLKREEAFDGVRISKNAWDSPFCDVNTKFLAVVLEAGGGGAFTVIPIEQYGRMDLNAPKVAGHKAAVLDIQFNPFNEHMIASASEDCTCKVWVIPEGGLTENLTEPAVDLDRHQRRVGIVEWHNTADNILFSAGFDYLICMWDVSTGDCVKEITCHSDTIYSMAFNWDGSVMATSSKDKKVRLIDPRSGEVIKETKAHDGNKAVRVIFLGELGYVCTTGFSRMSDRQLSILDPTDLSKLASTNIDTGSGVNFTFYDNDTKILYLFGKGDGNIRYYEMVADKPYFHYISQYGSSAPQRGVGWMPKAGLTIGECEVARGYKLHPKGFIEQISFKVPRKSTRFQEDIFPPTKTMEPTLSAAAWLGGETKAPAKVSLEGGYVAPARAFTAPVQEKAADPADAVPKGEKALLKAYHEQKQEIELLKKKLATAEIKIRQLSA